jgi:hypothetical protein
MTTWTPITPATPPTANDWKEVRYNAREWEISEMWHVPIDKLTEDYGVAIDEMVDGRTSWTEDSPASTDWS